MAHKTILFFSTLKKILSKHFFENGHLDLGISENCYKLPSYSIGQTDEEFYICGIPYLNIGSEENYTDEFRQKYLHKIIEFYKDKGCNLYLFLHEKDLYYSDEKIISSHFSLVDKYVWSITAEGRTVYNITENVRVFLFQHEECKITTFLHKGKFDSNTVEEFLESVEAVRLLLDRADAATIEGESEVLPLFDEIKHKLKDV